MQKHRDRERASALAAARFALARPNCARVGVNYDDARELGEELSELLPVRPMMRAGEGDRACDWLYLLVGLHRPCLFEAAEGARLGAAARGQETYVRLGFSALGPFVTLQEVRARLVDDGGGRFVVEEPVVGIQDTRLQLVVKGLQGALRKRRLVALDAAFLAQAACDHGLEAPADVTLWSLLFEPTPPTTTRALALAPARRSATTHGPGAKKKAAPGAGGGGTLTDAAQEGVTDAARFVHIVS